MALHIDTQPHEGRATNGVEKVTRQVAAHKTLVLQQAEFLIVFSHEIRAPLSVIMGDIERLTDELTNAENPVVDDILARLTHTTRTLRFLITNYLDFSRIEGSQVKLIRQALRLNDLIRWVLREYEPEARRRQITMQSQLQEPFPGLMGDAIALERVFSNLIDNALKFTPHGGCVTVTSRREADAVCVSIMDTGPGIPPVEASLLFEKHYRAPSTEHIAGCGLGLYIVKNLIDAHDGWVTVQNVPNSGSDFHVWLPLAQQ